jgi:transposase
MNKEDQKKQANRLHSQGYSFGEIAKELDVPKSTIYRWINERETGFETDNGTVWNDEESGPNTDETDMERSFQKSETILDDHETPVTESTNVEMEEIRLNHEYRMADLEFRKKQYEDQKKNDERVRREAYIKSVYSELANSTKQTRQEIDAIISAKRKSMADNDEEINSEPKLELPDGIIEKVKDVFVNYISWNKKEISGEELIAMLEKAENIKKRILRVVGHKKTQLNELEMWALLKQIITDLNNCISDVEDDEELILAIDDDWKQEVEEWLDSV